MTQPDPATAGGPRPGLDEPVFSEPWQAEAFAMVVALADRGVFTWAEWADALSAEVHRPDAAPDGHDYYHHWMRALETLLASKGVARKADGDVRDRRRRQTGRSANGWRRSSAQIAPPPPVGSVTIDREK